MARYTTDPLYERVVRELRGRIMSGIYRKGDSIPSEKELIESMGVSRITVRRAIEMLAEAGLIETSRGKKSVVIFDNDSLTGDEEKTVLAAEYVEAYRDVAQIRLIIEPEVAKLVALSATDDEVRRLEAALKGDFHGELIKVFGNKELIKIYENLIFVEETKAPEGIMTPDKQRTTMSVIDEQHLRILDAIRAHEADFAYFYMKEHNRYVDEMYERHFRIFLK